MQLFLEYETPADPIIQEMLTYDAYAYIRFKYQPSLQPVHD